MAARSRLAWSSIEWRSFMTRPRVSASRPGGSEGHAWMRPRAGESHRVAAAVGRDPDREAGGVSLDHLAAADHQADMAGRPNSAVRPGEEDEIAGLHLAGRYPRTPQPLLMRGTRNIDAGREVGLHHQAGAVVGVRSRSAPLIG